MVHAGFVFVVVVTKKLFYLVCFLWIYIILFKERMGRGWFGGWDVVGGDEDERCCLLSGDYSTVDTVDLVTESTPRHRLKIPFMAHRRQTKRMDVSKYSFCRHCLKLSKNYDNKSIFYSASSHYPSWARDNVHSFATTTTWQRKYRASETRKKR